MSVIIAVLTRAIGEMGRKITGMRMKGAADEEESRRDERKERVEE